MRTLAIVLNCPCLALFGGYFLYTGIHDSHPSGFLLVIPFGAALAALHFANKAWLAVAAFVVNVFMFLAGAIFVAFAVAQGIHMPPIALAKSLALFLALTAVPLVSLVALWPLFTARSAG